MNKKILILIILLFSFVKTNAIFECDSSFCDDSNQKNTPGSSYFLKDYYIAEIENINKDIYIKNIIGISSFNFVENLKILKDKNKLKFADDINKYYKNNPSKYVILRKDGDINTINALFKIKCNIDNFVIESNNQKIPFKENIFNINSCKNIKNMFLFEKIKLFLLIFGIIFIFLFLLYKISHKKNETL